VKHYEEARRRRETPRDLRLLSKLVKMSSGARALARFTIRSEMTLENARRALASHVEAA